MEEEVCKYQKFGFCKFKERCEKRHLEKTCEKRSSCDSLKTCQKRHPYVCKRYVMEGFCKFGTDCAYHHQAKEKNTNESEIIVKVDKLEKTVDVLNAKILQLESKIKEIESKDMESGKIKEKKIIVEDPKKVQNDKRNSKSIKETMSKPNDKKDMVFKFGAEARKTAMESKESKKEDKISKQFKCELCEYSCEKQATLNKHMNTKHTEQKCKACKQEFKTSMELVSHVAKEHHLEDDEWNGEFHNTPKGGKDKLNSSFMISKSELDED